MNIPETASQIKQAAHAQIARLIEQAHRDRDDPRLAGYDRAIEISASLDDLSARLHDLEAIILNDSTETHS